MLYTVGFVYFLQWGSPPVHCMYWIYNTQLPACGCTSLSSLHLYGHRNLHSAMLWIWLCLAVWEIHIHCQLSVEWHNTARQLAQHIPVFIRQLAVCFTPAATRVNDCEFANCIHSSSATNVSCALECITDTGRWSPSLQSPLLSLPFTLTGGLVFLLLAVTALLHPDLSPELPTTAH